MLTILRASADALRCVTGAGRVLPRWGVCGGCPRVGCLWVRGWLRVGVVRVMTPTLDAAWRDALSLLPDPAVVSAEELSGLVGVLGDMQAALDAVKVRTAG